MLCVLVLLCLKVAITHTHKKRETCFSRVNEFNCQKNKKKTKKNHFRYFCSFLLWRAKQYTCAPISPRTLPFEVEFAVWPFRLLNQRRFCVVVYFLFLQPHTNFGLFLFTCRYSHFATTTLKTELQGWLNTLRCQKKVWCLSN